MFKGKKKILVAPFIRIAARAEKLQLGRAKKVLFSLFLFLALRKVRLPFHLQECEKDFPPLFLFTVVFFGRASCDAFAFCILDLGV